MKYYKYVGNHWVTYYALSDEEVEVKVFEFRYKGPILDDVIETAFAYICNPILGSYDIISADVIRGYDSCSKQEWKAAEKRFIEWVKKVGE